MDRFLLDTDAVIDYLKGYPDTVTLIRELYQAGVSLCICDVVAAEVVAGLLPKNRAQGLKFLHGGEFLPTTLEIAAQAGEWRYRYARGGITLSTTDTLIAATAYGYQAKLITGNTDDYPMSEVETVALPRPSRKGASP